MGKARSEDKASAEAIGRLISVALQQGTMIEDLISTIKGIQGNDVKWDDGKEIRSVPDAIAQVLDAVVKSGKVVDLEKK